MTSEQQVNSNRQAEAPHGSGFSHIFCTPLLVHRPVSVTPELIEKLKQAVLQRENDTGSQNLDSSGVIPLKSNQDGWMSNKDLLTWQEEGIEAIKQIYIEGFARFIAHVKRKPMQNIKAGFRMTAWANVSRDKGFNTPHSHVGESHLSAVFYVSAGEPEPEPVSNGCLQFVDPRNNPSIIPGMDDSANLMLIRPQAGLLVVFPGWLTHFVHPFRGQGARISLACNAIVKNLEITD